MNPLLDIINFILLLCLLVPLSIFLIWNWQYRNATNGLKITRDTIQHWTSSLFYLVGYLALRRVSTMLGWTYPPIINQIIATALYIYLLFRTWDALIIFKKIRDGEIKVGDDMEQ